MIPETDPASVLLEMETRVRARQHTLPLVSTDSKKTRRFLGFKLADTRLAIAATQVLQSPLSTRVPGAPPWLWGVAGLGGYPLPIIDFAILCDTPRQWSENEIRVLVIQHQQARCGLLVDSVYGLVLPKETSAAIPPELKQAAGIAGYLHGSCHSDDTLWGIVNPARIFQRLAPIEHLEKAG